MRLASSVRLMPWVLRASLGTTEAAAQLTTGLLAVAGMLLVIRLRPDLAQAHSFSYPHLAPFVLVFLGPEWLRRLRQEASGFLLLTPHARLEQLLATAAVDLGLPLLLGLLSSALMPPQLRPLALLATGAALGSGALATHLTDQGPLPRQLLYAGVLLITCALILWGPNGLQVKVALAGLLLDLGYFERLARKDRPQDRPMPPGSSALDRLTDGLAGFRQTVLWFFLRSEKLAQGLLSILLVALALAFIEPRLLNPGLVVTGAGMAGAGLARFLTGSAGRTLSLWPVPGRWFRLTFVSYGLAAVLLLPTISGLGNGLRSEAALEHQLGRAVLRKGQLCPPPADDMRCAVKHLMRWESIMSLPSRHFGPRDLAVVQLSAGKWGPGPGPRVLATYRRFLEMKTAGMILVAITGLAVGILAWLAWSSQRRYLLGLYFLLYVALGVAQEQVFERAFPPPLPAAAVALAVLLLLGVSLRQLQRARSQ